MIVITAQTTSIDNVFVGDEVEFFVTATGDGNLSYSWFKELTITPGSPIDLLLSAATVNYTLESGDDDYDFYCHIDSDATEPTEDAIDSDTFNITNLSEDIPVIVISSVIQRNDGSKLVDIEYTGTDPNNTQNNLVVNSCEYSLDNVNWINLTPKTGDSYHSGVSNLSFDSGGQNFTYVWDALTDLGFDVEDPTVYVRLKSNNGLNDSNLADYQVTGGIDTVPPVINSFEIDPASIPENGVTESNLVTLNIDTTGATQIRFSVNLKREWSTHKYTYWQNSQGSVTNGASYFSTDNYTPQGDVGKTLTFVDSDNNVKDYIIASISGYNATLAGFTSDHSASNLKHNIATWSDWETIDSQMTIDITSATYGGVAGDGLRRITMQIKDDAGNMTDGNKTAYTWYKTSAKGIKILTGANINKQFHYYGNALEESGNIATDIIEIQDSLEYLGCYRDTLINITGKGILRNKTGETPSIWLGFDGNKRPMNGSYGYGETAFTISGGGDITFKGITFKGFITDPGAYSTGALRFIAANDTIENCSFIGDQLTTAISRFQFNVKNFRKNFIYLRNWSGDFPPILLNANNVWENNIIYDEINPTVQCNGSGAYFINNVHYTGNGLVYNSTAHEFKFYNNIFIGGVRITKSGSGAITFKNNCFSAAPTMTGMTTPVGTEGNFIDDAELAGSDYFDTDSYKLLLTSPCIDTGTTEDIPVDDFFNETRNADIPTIGAWTPVTPVITEQPESAFVDIDVVVTFEVVATGNPDSISYQWYRDGEIIVDATSSTLEVISSLDEFGVPYHVVVTSDNIVVTSNTVDMTYEPYVPENKDSGIGTKINIDNISANLGRTIQLVKPYLNVGVGLMGINISVSSASLVTIKIGSTTIFEIYLPANGSYQYKATLPLYIDNSIGEMMKVVTTGTGKLKISGYAVIVAKS